MMQTDILWKAAVLTVVVFAAGITLGIWLDNQRLGQTRSQLTETDIQWNDARLSAQFYQLSNGRGEDWCKNAIGSNLEFNDRIFRQGQVLGRYETVNRFAPELLQEKRRYALLQLQFWLNSISLRKSCNATYSTLIYFYKHYDEGLETTQKAQSAVLAALKDRCGNSLLLVPLPFDLDISTISLVAKQHNITSAPSLLVNEDAVFEGLTDLGDLEKIIRC